MPTGSDLRELDDDELEGRLGEYRRELLNLRFQLATGQLDNITRLSTVRKDVARVLTILRDREIALAEGRFAGPVESTRRRRPVEDIEDELETPAPRARRRRAAEEAEAGDGSAVDDEVDVEAVLDTDDVAAGPDDEADEDEEDEA
jgi:large subunit ribosomal protein L29